MGQSTRIDPSAAHNRRERFGESAAMETRLPDVNRGGAAEALPQSRHSAGDPIAANCQPIEVRVAELSQLFNAADNGGDAWRSDWPAAPRAAKAPRTGERRVRASEGLPGPKAS